MNELALLNNLFDDAMGSYGLPSFTFKSAYSGPKVDIKETKDIYVLQMDLPGRTEKDVDIELDHNVLTISSVKDAKKEEKSDKDKWLLRERNYVEFSRRFSLPEDVDGSRLAASFKNGVLTVEMPRKTPSAPQKITITSAD